MQLILQVQVKSLKNLSLFKCFARTIMNLAESKDDAHRGTGLQILGLLGIRKLHPCTGTEYAIISWGKALCGF